MKLSALAMTLTALWSAGALAAGPSVEYRGNVSVREMVPYLESHYGGEVVAIALDASGDKAAHYHVDMFYPGAGTAKLDVDAATLEISGRGRPLAADGLTSLAGAAAFAATHVEGEVIAAEVDAIDGGAAHYDIDLRLSSGEIARLKVDSRTREIGWRKPPIVAD